MVGSIASNLHEGHRSEYLAQYVFASFGTALAVSGAEDYGLDLQRTLVERIGKRSWPREYFSVQVKSTLDPWVFEGKESVRWLVQHPLPVYLCTVDKSEARLRIYHTCPRFYVWSIGEHPDRMELRPGVGHKGHCTQWTGSYCFDLSAPILDFTIQDFLANRVSHEPTAVLSFWLKFDRENLRRITEWRS